MLPLPGVHHRWSWQAIFYEIVLKCCIFIACLQTSSAIFSQTKAAQFSENLRDVDYLSVGIQPQSEKNCKENSQRFSTRKSLVIVSTLDGQITALDSQNFGEILWSLKTNSIPLFESTIENLKFSSEDKTYRLIPSLDGNFYMYDSMVAQGIPLSADTLLSSSIKFFNNDVITGGKEITTFGLRVETGKIIYSYSLGNKEYLVPKNAKNENDRQDEMACNLVIRRTSRIIRAVDASTGVERWNVTVGQHELFVPNSFDKNNEQDFLKNCQIYDEDKNGQKSLIENCRQDCVTGLQNLEFRLSPADGVVAAYDKAKRHEPVWIKQLNSPIAQVWSLNYGHLNELSLFDPNIVPYLSKTSWFSPLEQRQINRNDMIIYLGTYKNAKYIIPSPGETRKLKFLVNQQELPVEANRLYLAANSFDLNAIEPAVIHYDDETVSHSIGSQNGRCFENCPTCSSDEVHSLILKDAYPKDMGWFLFKQYDPKANLLLNFDKKTVDSKNGAGQNIYANNYRPNFLINHSKRDTIKFLMLTWWDIFVFLGVPSVAITIIICFLIKRIYFPDINVVENQKILHNNLSNDSTALIKSESSFVERNVLLNDYNNTYESWYLKLFVPIRCLGKGGFGVVIESLNKLDQQSYAVKRITVSNRPDGQERVQREVRALAKLDHPNIVRYYNSWLEEPPPNWQEKWDKEFTKMCSSPSCSSYYAADYNDGCSTKRHKFFDEHENFVTKKSTIDSQLNAGHCFDHASTSSLEIIFATDQRDDAKNSKIFNDVNDLETISRSPPTNGILTTHCTSNWQTNGSADDVKNDGNVLNKKRRNGENGDRKAFLFIQMQLCRDQTLKDWLLPSQNHRPRSRRQIFDWIDQLLCAVQYVHDSGLIHRDIKPSNIFFDQNYQLKIGDFGLAKCFVGRGGNLTSVDSCIDQNVNCNQSISATNHSDHQMIKCSTSSSHTDNVGTWMYMSPEQEKGDDYTYKVDIYALGLIFFEMLVPFSTEMERRQVLAKMKKENFCFPQQFIKEFPEEMKIIGHMIIHDPDQRWTCKQVRCQQIFADFWPLRSISVCSTIAHQQELRSRNSCSIGDDF